MLTEENAHYFVYEDIPISVGIVNGAVGINLTDEQGTLKGGLRTENETVHTWAVDLFETYREKATPVKSDVISA
jgi:predicted transcriptional regulator